MKKIVLAALALSVATGLSSLAFAEDAMPGKSMPKPAAELSQLKFFVGSWSCSGKAFQTPMGPEHASVGKASVRPDLGGFWYSVRYEETKTTVNPMPYRVGAFWGYDGGQKKLVASSVDGMGGYAAQSAAGWDGDKLVFTGDIAGMGPSKMPARDTFTKKGENEFMHTGEFSMAEGQWTKTDEETCHRAGVAAAAKTGSEAKDAKAEPAKK